jgi:hypothetical protein
MSLLLNSLVAKLAEYASRTEIMTIGDHEEDETFDFGLVRQLTRRCPNVKELNLHSIACSENADHPEELMHLSNLGESLP